MHTDFGARTPETPVWMEGTEMRFWNTVNS